jgi:ribonuclease HI
MVEIYTDGAYSSSRNQGGWAFVVLKDGTKVSSAFDSVVSTTNNRMEVQSAIEAIKHMKNQNIKEFTIYSDSMYLVGTMTKNWKRNKNVDLWIELDDLIQDLTINWEHTKGHSGNKYNDYCDMLAVHASHLINK